MTIVIKSMEDMRKLKGAMIDKHTLLLEEPVYTGENKYRCLAVFYGMLCVVELKATPLPAANQPAAGVVG